MNTSFSRMLQFWPPRTIFGSFPLIKSKIEKLKKQQRYKFAIKMPFRRTVSLTSTSSGSTSTASAPSSRSNANKKRPPVFPKRLYEMLENAERDGYAHVISWMPDGKSFKIHGDGNETDEQAFVEVLKRTFNQTRFKSFLRQLQLYGFDRTYKGPNRGECRHKLFVRGRRDLLHKKSIDDFQRTANEGSIRSPKPQMPEVASSMPMPPQVPSCSSFGRTASGSSTCSYFETSVIPTKLYNLVLPESDNSVKASEDDDELSLAIRCQKPIKNHTQEEDDVLSIHSSEEVPSWSGVELKILQCAL